MICQTRNRRLPGQPCCLSSRFRSWLPMNPERTHAGRGERVVNARGALGVSSPGDETFTTPELEKNKG